MILLQQATGREVLVADDQVEFWLGVGYQRIENKAAQRPAAPASRAKK